MLDKLLAAGAYTIANNIDYRLPTEGRSVNLGTFDAQHNVTVNPLARDLVDKLLSSVVEPAPAQARKPARKPKAEHVDDDLPDLDSILG